MHRTIATALVALLASAPATAWADTDAPATEDKTPAPNVSPWEVNFYIDVPATVVTFLIGGFPRLLVDDFVAPACAPDCALEQDESELNPLDRMVVGNSSEMAGSVADTLFMSSMALPFVLNSLDAVLRPPDDGWTGYLTDTVVLAQTASVVLSINNMLSFIVRRPRPLFYDEDRGEKSRFSGSAQMSFPSGHTSGSFAMATAYSLLYMKRHPDSALVIPLWLLTYAMATTVGVLRPFKGDHFPTDVIVGGALGISTGLLIPWLHEKAAPDAQGIAGAPSLWQRTQIVPTPIGLQGFGLSLTIR